MKGLVLVLTMLVIWYFAGMFWQTWMMVLAVCMGLIAVLMTAAAIYQRRRMSLIAAGKRSIAFKKIENEVSLLAENRSILPVNRYRVKLLLRYSTDTRGTKRTLAGCANGKNSSEDNSAGFYIIAPYCGVINVELKRLIVYDPLTLFSSSRRLSEKGEIMVFPVEKRMNIIMPSVGSADDIPLTETRTPKQGDDHSEVHLIREYRPGDLARHIHHNYSAKTDSIWVKEFTKDNDMIFDLFLDTSGCSSMQTDDWDAFYEIVFSVTVALVRRDVSVNVRYFNREKGGPVEFCAANDGMCAELLAQLYFADKECKREELFGNTDASAPGSMIINTKLEWYFSGRPIYCFTKEKTEAELSAVPFRL